MTSVPLGELLIEQKQTIGDPAGGDMPLLGVSNRDGIQRSAHPGSANLSRYKIVRPSWFAYNPMRINVGSIGWAGADTVGIISPDYVVFSCNDRLVPEYLWHFLKSEVGQREICKNTTGSVRERLYFDSLARIELSLPSIDQQLRIASELSELKSKIAIVQQRVEGMKQCDLPQLRQTILQLAVQGQLVPQDPNDKPASVLFADAGKERTAASGEASSAEHCANRELPVGWTIATMGRLFRFIDYRGKTPAKTPSGVRLITAKNVRMGFLKDEPFEYISEETYPKWMTRGLPEPGDLLFTTEAPMGNICLAPTGERFALAQRTINLHPVVRIDSHFAMYAIMSSPIQTAIADLATGMTATGIKASKLKLVEVPVPPLAEQKRIVAKVTELLSLCDTLEAQLQTAESASSQLLSAAVHHLLTEEAAE